MRARPLVFALLLAPFLLATPCFPQEAATPPPEGASGISVKQAVTAKNWMVVSANPLASEAGAKILRAGGKAVDAAIAVQLVLGLVEPQSSGLGGGAFLVYWDNKTKKLTTFDARETAPLEATPLLFQDKNGQPLTYEEAVIGGLSVATPSTPRLLEAMHEKYGKLNWAENFNEAISLAENGFAVSPRLAALIVGNKETLKRFKPTARYFLNPDGTALKAGTLLRNPAYADTLRILARDGMNAFYSGPIAEDIVSTVRNAPGNPGLLSLEDLRIYRVKERAPVCTFYRGRDVCGMGPPSSGAITVGQILRLVERFDLKGLGPASPIAWQIIADASRLAFADRGRFIADSDFVPVPVRGLLAADYMSERSALITKGSKLTEVKPGAPKYSHAQLWSDGRALEFPSTSHFTIVDRDGDVVSMTTTIEAGFGSRLFVRGFLLNNQLTDFSFETQRDGVPIANRVEPGKRPRSSMAPTIVFKDGAPVLALGSPGGSQIIGYVAKALIANIDWGLDVQAAISLPNVVNRTGAMEVEENSSAANMAPAFEAMGYEVKSGVMTSGLHGIAIENGKLTGGADPRREGLAVGE